MKENVRPTVKSAVLVGTDKLKLTFSEAVNVKDANATDFALVVGGQTVASNKVTAPTPATTNQTEVVFTLTTPVSAGDITSGLALKPLDTLDIVDQAGNDGNLLNVPGNIAITH